MRQNGEDMRHNGKDMGQSYAEGITQYLSYPPQSATKDQSEPKIQAEFDTYLRQLGSCDAYLCPSGGFMGQMIAVPAADAFQRGKAAYDREAYLTALQQWRPLAQQGYAPAKFDLGFMYAEGQGVAKDDVE